MGDDVDVDVRLACGDDVTGSVVDANAGIPGGIPNMGGMPLGMGIGGIIMPGGMGGIPGMPGIMRGIPGMPGIMGGIPGMGIDMGIDMGMV